MSTLDKLKIVDGKDNTKKSRPTTLDQVWGDTGLTKYGTMDEEKYLRELDEMDRADLNAHATKLGILPIQDRSRLTIRLRDEFRQFVGSYNVPSEPEVKQKRIKKEALKILAEGR